MTTDDRSLEELLAAYVLDACDPAEVAGVEALLRRRPELSAEVDRLAAAAAWLGALAADEPPAALRDAVLATTRDDPMAGARRLYDAEAQRLSEELDRLDPDRYEERTPNGLSARSLVIHLAAQESLLAQAVGQPVADLRVADVDERTAVLVNHYRDRTFDEIVELWRRAVAAVSAWARDGARDGTTVDWLDLPMSAADALTARAFENWLHRDDLRRVRGAAGDPPPGRELAVMTALAVRTLPAGLAKAGRSRPGRSARMVLTGEGGGHWDVPLDPATAAGDVPDVTVTASALDWCLLAGERLEPAALPHTVDGDAELAAALVGAASAFATL